MPPKFKFTRKEIVETAFKIVRRGGWAALTARSLGSELGASSRPIYSFFNSMTELEEEVVKKAVDLLFQFMSQKRTDDPWIDHGIGYVMFGSEEKQLFRAVNDENHIVYFKKYGDVIWDRLTGALSDYPGFHGLTVGQVFKVQGHRWLFAHGLAFQASNPPPGVWDDDTLFTVMQEGSKAILDGLKHQFQTSELKAAEEDKMSERDPRKMALQIAGVRASETHLPEGERVFVDPYAERFLPTETRERLRDLASVRTSIAMYEKMMPGVNGAIVARIRFIDEVLLECIATGFGQAVIVGAGYDTRAYRFESVKQHLEVFEVDHPVTQQFKKEKIIEIFESLPEHVKYVPVNFGVDRMDQKLLENGYNPRLKTLFIVEGLLMYIPPPAVDGLLAFIVNVSGPGSALVADYFSTAVVDGTSPLKEAKVLREFVESEGASLQFGIEEGEAEAFFQQRGFDSITVASSASCKEKYFKAGSMGRKVSPMFNYLFATTPVE